jgi:hypothetical protein
MTCVSYKEVPATNPLDMFDDAEHMYLFRPHSCAYSPLSSVRVLERNVGTRSTTCKIRSSPRHVVESIPVIIDESKQWLHTGVT